MNKNELFIHVKKRIMRFYCVLFVLTSLGIVIVMSTRGSKEALIVTLLAMGCHVGLYLRVRRDFSKSYRFTAEGIQILRKGVVIHCVDWSDVAAFHEQISRPTIDCGKRRIVLDWMTSSELIRMMTRFGIPHPTARRSNSEKATTSMHDD